MNVMTAATQLMVAKKHNEYRTLRSKIFFKDSDNKFNSYFLETVNDITPTGIAQAKQKIKLPIIKFI